MKRRTSGSIGSPASGEKTPAAGYKVQDGGPRVGARWSRLELKKKQKTKKNKVNNNFFFPPRLFAFCWGST
jgi:hypothetical protein